MSRAVMQQALDALEDIRGDNFGYTVDEYPLQVAAIAALRSELAKAAPDPVMIYNGRCIIDCEDGGHQDVMMLKMIAAGSKLYTKP